MKTPTLIVRLIGLYLLYVGISGLMQLNNVQKMTGNMPVNPMTDSLLSSVQMWTILALILGAAATCFAGPLARVLTFDSEPRTETDLDFGGKFLPKK